MFEIESKGPDSVTIHTASKVINFDLTNSTIDASLTVGQIVGPCEVEIGEANIRGIAVKDGKVIYDVEVGNVHVGILGDIEDGLDDLGVAQVLCTSSVRAVREIDPKLVIATGNVDGMVTELKLTARAEKKLKVKSLEALPAAMEVVALN